MNLSQKIKKAQKIIKEAENKWPAQSIAVAWTDGKDSTVLLPTIFTL